jgi:hypothetical protein
MRDFALFACAAQFIEDPRLKGDREDDGGMGMVNYERWATLGRALKTGSLIVDA